MSFSVQKKIPSYGSFFRVQTVKHDTIDSMVLNYHRNRYMRNISVDYILCFWFTLSMWSFFLEAVAKPCSLGMCSSRTFPILLLATLVNVFNRFGVVLEILRLLISFVQLLLDISIMFFYSLIL